MESGVELELDNTFFVLLSQKSKCFACLEVLAAACPEVLEPEHGAEVPGGSPAHGLRGEVHIRPEGRLLVHNLPQPSLPEVSVQLRVVICSNDGKTLVMTSSPCHTTTQLLSLEVEFHNLVHHKNCKSECCLMLVTKVEVTKHVSKRLYTTML